MPSVQLRDDNDFVPTPKSIVFGHHFTSIAGTGPIVGPALAVLWGWLPALLWVLLGSVFIGAVHDLGTLVVSLRSRGQTVGDIAGRVINPRVRVLFLTILLFALWLVLAIFGLVIANTFKAFPESVLPVFLQIPIAVWIGLVVHRRGKNILLPSAIALALMYLTVWLGAAAPGGRVDRRAGRDGDPAPQRHARRLAGLGLGRRFCWRIATSPASRRSGCCCNPRDYINSLQLISSLGLMVLGLAAAAIFRLHGEPLAIVAPAVNEHPAGAPPFVPFLFITIACGAISGFHCLVSSGTSSKQLRCETDAQFVGYGSMLTEGFLAVLVIIAVSAGLGLGWEGKAEFAGLRGGELWNAVYANWDAVYKLNTAPFIVGAANIVGALGIDPVMSRALIAVLVASFAGTTLDTATRPPAVRHSGTRRDVRPAGRSLRVGNRVWRPRVHSRGRHAAAVDRPALVESDLSAHHAARRDAVRRADGVRPLAVPRHGPAVGLGHDRQRGADPLAAVRGDEPTARRAGVFWSSASGCGGGTSRSGSPRCRPCSCWSCPPGRC